MPQNTNNVLDCKENLYKVELDEKLDNLYASGLIPAITDLILLDELFILIYWYRYTRKTR